MADDLAKWLRDPKVFGHHGRDGQKYRQVANTLDKQREEIERLREVVRFADQIVSRLPANTDGWDILQKYGAARSAALSSTTTERGDG